jgi:SAM-dependent methyltransferase
MAWVDFFDRDHSLYVNARHKRLHFADLGKTYCALVPHSRAQVLDYGCGEALAAPALAKFCDTLWLYDLAPSMQARLRAAFAREPHILVLSTEALEALPDTSLDMILVNSVVQYLQKSDLERLLAVWVSKLKPEGQLVLADILPKDHAVMADVVALLRFALRGGFFFAALVGLGKTFFSSYRHLRRDLGLETYDFEDLSIILATYGLRAEKMPVNIGHNQSRFTCKAIKDR